MKDFTGKSKNDALIWVLKLEHSIKDRSGLYGYTQRALAYHSNRIKHVSSLKQAQVSGDVSKLTQYFKEEQKAYAVQCEMFDIYKRYQTYLEEKGV
jgi:hypothetical protein